MIDKSTFLTGNHTYLTPVITLCPYRMDYYSAGGFWEALVTQLPLGIDDSLIFLAVDSSRPTSVLLIVKLLPSGFLPSG